VQRVEPLRLVDLLGSQVRFAGRRGSQIYEGFLEFRPTQATCQLVHACFPPPRSFTPRRATISFPLSDLGSPRPVGDRCALVRRSDSGRYCHTGTDSNCPKRFLIAKRIDVHRFVIIPLKRPVRATIW
jgi:hypothetical protein